CRYCSCNFQRLLNSLSFAAMRLIPFHFLQILLLTIPSVLVSQDTDVSAIVIDATTEEPIPYVNIGVVNRNLGTVSDYEGAFKLEQVDHKESIRFSALGYATLDLSVMKLMEESTVRLVPRQYDFEAVEVKASSLGDVTIVGARNQKGRGLSIGFGSTMLGTEIGAPIEVKQPILVSSMHFKLNHAKGDSLLFRLNIYDFADGQVGEKVLRENVYLKDAQRRGEYTMDLKEYEIVLKDDVMVSLEWLRNFDEVGNKDMTFDSKKMKKPSGLYLRSTSNTDFRKLNPAGRSTPCFYLTGRPVN
ncbi:MAG: carboxypeptidase-like regulatory domain-containing protein, partial [Saprospiraceae bacterium]|nr:carboxypeptidase-like regulatory domain-containing protein [Saprospiraceae bacterium]